MHFGPYDEKLIELKIEHNVNQTEAPQKLFQNLDEIKDLILNKNFGPFPPSKTYHHC